MATTIDPQMTLGELVTSRPLFARELERHGLDYCCGGTTTLQDACLTQHLDPVVVARELDAIAGDDEPDTWASMGPTQLVEHIVATHHRYLWDELPRLAALTDKIVGVHGDHHPELIDVRDRFSELRADLEPHMSKEEQLLFPMIQQLAANDTAASFHNGTIQNPISVMLEEHERVGELLAQLRALTNGYETPTDGCASYHACHEGLAHLEADTHLHVHKENNLLFPAAIELETRLEERP